MTYWLTLGLLLEEKTNRFCLAWLSQEEEKVVGRKKKQKKPVQNRRQRDRERPLDYSKGFWEKQPIYSSPFFKKNILSCLFPPLHSLTFLNTSYLILYIYALFNLKLLKDERDYSFPLVERLFPVILYHYPSLSWLHSLGKVSGVVGLLDPFESSL